MLGAAMASFWKPVCGPPPPKPAQSQRIPFYYVYWVIGLFASTVALPCLAMGGRGQQAYQPVERDPSEFVFTINEVEPYFPKLGPHQFKLVPSPFGWSLVFWPENLNVADAAEAEFFRLPDRPSSLTAKNSKNVRNPISLSKWIMNLNSGEILSGAKGHLDYPTQTTFTSGRFFNALYDFKSRFIEKFSEDQIKAAKQGNDISAEAWFLPNVVIGWLTAMLSDEHSRTRVENAMKTSASHWIVPYTIPLNSQFIVTAYGQKWKNSLVGSVVVTPKADPQNLFVAFHLNDPEFATQFPKYGTAVGGLQASLPIESLDIKIPELRFNSELLTEELHISPSENVVIHAAYERNDPLQLSMAAVYSRNQQVSDEWGLKFDRSNLHTGIKSMVIQTIEAGGHTFKVSDFDLGKMLQNPEIWKAFTHNLIGNKAIPALFGKATEIVKQIAGPDGIPFHKTLVVIDQKTGDKKTRFSIKPLVAGNEITDPEKNPNIIARFDVDVPIQVESAHLNLSGNKKDDDKDIHADFRGDIQSPTAELSEFSYLDHGATVFHSSDLKAKLSITHKVDSATTIAGQGSVSAQKTPELTSLQSNLKDIGIPKPFDYSLDGGKTWLAAPELNLNNLLRQNRKYWVEHLITHPDPDQRGVVEKIQGNAEVEIRKEVSRRLSEMKFSISDMGSWKLGKLAEISGEGSIRTPDLRIDEDHVRFRDLPTHICHGFYYISAVTDLAIDHGIDLVGDQIKVALKTKPINAGGNLKIGQLSAMMNPEKGSLRVSFTTDICLNDTAEGFDARMRPLDALSEPIRFTHIQPTAVNMDSSLKGLAWWKDEITTKELLVSSDEDIVKSIATSLLSQTQSQISKEFSLILQKFLEQRIPEYLDSIFVKSVLDQRLAELRESEKQLVIFMWNIGDNLESPLEDLIKEQVAAYFTKPNGAADSKGGEPSSSPFELVVKKQSEVLQDLLTHAFGRIADQFDARVFVTINETLYGISSRPALASDLERILQPSYGEIDLANLIGSDTSARKLESPETVLPELMASLFSISDSCPFKHPESTFASFQNRIRQHADLLNPIQIEDIMASVKTHCVSPQLKETAEQLGLSALNDFFFSMPLSFESEVNAGASVSPHAVVAQAAATVAASSPSSSTSLDAFVEGWQSSGVHYRDLGENEHAVQVTFSNPKIPGRPSLKGPFNRDVLNWLKASDQSIVLRIPRETWNQKFRDEVDWPKLLAEYFPEEAGDPAQIKIKQRPMLNENGDLEFSIFAKGHFLVVPVIKLLVMMLFPQTTTQEVSRIQHGVNQVLDNATDVVISLFQLEKVFGRNVDVAVTVPLSIELVAAEKGSTGDKVLRIELQEFQIRNLETSLVQQVPVRTALKAAHQPLTIILNDFLSKSHFKPFEFLANRLSPVKVQLYKGDLYILYERSDPLPKIAMNGPVKR